MLTLIIVLIAVAVVVLVSAGFVVTGRRRALRLPERPVAPPVPPPPAPVTEAAPPDLLAEPVVPEAPEALEAPPEEGPPEPPRMRDRLGRARNLFAGYLTSVRSRD